MTIINDNVTAVNKQRTNARLATNIVPAASVWDVREVSSRGGSHSGVRTLSVRARTFEHPENFTPRSRRTHVERIESRRDTARKVFLGSVMGLSMFVGLAFGGVFTPEEAAPQYPVDYTASVIAK